LVRRRTRKKKTFGKNLREQRLAAGYELASELARTLGIDRAHISRWENDRTGLPEVPTLVRLGKALGCSIDRLLEGIDPDYDAIAMASRDIAR